MAFLDFLFGKKEQEPTVTQGDVVTEIKKINTRFTDLPDSEVARMAATQSPAKYGYLKEYQPDALVQPELIPKPLRYKNFEDLQFAVAKQEALTQIQQFRQQYPKYNDVNDVRIATELERKFPDKYKNYTEIFTRIDKENKAKAEEQRIAALPPIKGLKTEPLTGGTVTQTSPFEPGSKLEQIEQNVSRETLEKTQTALRETPKAGFDLAKSLINRKDIDIDALTKFPVPKIKIPQKTYISPAPPKPEPTVMNRIKTKLTELYEGSPDYQIARAQNAYAISKLHNIPFETVVNNYDTLSRTPNITGMSPIPTSMEIVEGMMMFPVAAGLATHPAATILGIGGFMALSEIENAAVSMIEKQGYQPFAGKTVADILPGQPKPGVKEGVEILDFIAKAGILGGIYKKSPAMLEKFTKDFVTEYNLPKRVYIEPAKIKSIFQTGENISPAEMELVKGLGLDGAEYRAAINKGVSIEVPAERVITMTDKPYWAKLKSLFGAKPSTYARTEYALKPGIAPEIAGSVEYQPGVIGQATIPGAPIGLPAGVEKPPATPAIPEQITPKELPTATMENATKDEIELATSLRNDAVDRYMEQIDYPSEVIQKIEENGKINVQFFKGKEEWVETVKRIPINWRARLLTKGAGQDLDEAASSVGMNDTGLMEYLRDFDWPKKPGTIIADYLQEARETLSLGKTTPEIPQTPEPPAPTVTGDLQLAVGDKIKIGDEWHKVTKHSEGELTLENGNKIKVDDTFAQLEVQGIQRVERGEAIAARPITPELPEEKWPVTAEASRVRAGMIRRVESEYKAGNIDKITYDRLIKKWPPIKPPTVPETLPSSNINKLPKYEGKAYRAITGYKHGVKDKASDVVNYEQEELGNKMGVTPEVIKELEKYPASSLVWVGKKATDVENYGKPELIEIKEGAKIIAEDGDGGYLVLNEGKPKQKTIEEPDVMTLPEDALKREITQPLPGDILEKIEGKDIIEPEPGKIIKKSEIIKYFAEKLGVPIRKGRFRQRALGIYKTKADLIRWKKRFAVPHEVGHYIDDNLKDIAILFPKEEWQRFVGKFPPKLQTRKEGIAEFISEYIMDRTSARAKAPKFFEHFKKTMKAEHPEISNIIDNAALMYKQWRAMPAVAKVKSQMSFKPERKPLPKFEDIYTMMIDDMNPIKNYVKVAKDLGHAVVPDDDPYVLSRLLKGWVGKANHILEYGTFDPNTLKVTGKGLKAIISPIDKLGGTAIEDFEAYLIARHNIERLGAGKETGIDLKTGQDAVIELEAKYPGFKESAEEITAFQDRIVDYLIESGLIERKNVNIFREKYKNYVPLYRVMEGAERKGALGKTIANVSSPIKRAKGSELDIVRPLESIIKNVYAFVNASERNRVAAAIVSLTKLDPQLARIVEKVPPDMMKVATVTGDQMFSKEEMSDLGLTPDDVNKSVDIFRPAFRQGDQVISVRIGGKPEYFYIADKPLYEALMNLNREQINIVFKILAYPARALRAGATLAPEFLGRNPFRDQFSAAIFSEYGYKPFIDLWGGVADVFGRKDLYQLWLRAGGAQSSLVSLDREYISKNIKEVLKGKNLWNPLEALRALSELGEQATRLGEMRLGIRKGKSATEAALASREVTLDFARMGAKTQAVNSIVAFWNAQIQGADKIFREFKKNPRRMMGRILSYIIIPSAVLYYFNKDDEEYKEHPQWVKDFFWLVKSPRTGRYIRIPKPFELGVLFGSGAERMLEFIDKRDPEALKKLMLNFTSAITPQFMPTAFTPIVENITNHSFFRDRPLEIEKVNKLIPGERYNRWTPTLYRKMGEWTGLSPIKIENLMRGYFAGLGSLVVTTPDVAHKAYLTATGKPTTTEQYEFSSEDIPLVKGFTTRDPYGYNSESAIRFFDRYEEMAMVYETEKKYRESGREEKAKEMREDHPEIIMYKQAQGVVEILGKIRKEQDRIMAKELPLSEKKEKIDKLNRVITKEAKYFNELYDKHLK